MNLFECVLKTSSGGGGADLVVTCSNYFAGQTITCSDGGSNTFTEVCPSSSPYTVTFASIPVGTYTISGVISGQTYSTTVTITDFSATLNTIPNGATITPTDDIQTWLHCADIWDKNYTTISAVLADTTTLLALISSNNAADYMARSTTWANSVVADQTAMGYIGNNDYCADKLLSDSTWSNAICNSTYFESVLNVKVPTMTSDTTPSGEVIKSGQYGAEFASFKAFANQSQGWIAESVAGSNKYIGYGFTNNVRVNKLMYKMTNSTQGRTFNTSIKLQGSLDNSSWDDIQTITTSEILVNTNEQFIIISNNNKYKFYRLIGDWNIAGTGTLLQFYGRA